MGRASALLTLSTLSGSTPSQSLAINDEIRADMMLSTLEIHEALPGPQTQAGSNLSASDL